MNKKTFRKLQPPSGLKPTDKKSSTGKMNFNNLAMSMQSFKKPTSKGFPMPSAGGSNSGSQSGDIGFVQQSGVYFEDEPQPGNQQPGNQGAATINMQPPNFSGQATMNIPNFGGQATINMPAPNMPAPDGQATINMSVPNMPTPGGQATMNMQPPNFSGPATVNMNMPGANYAAGNQSPLARTEPRSAEAHKSNTTGGIPKQKKKNKSDPYELIGTIFGGKFEVTKFLGQGGMGAVYMGSHKLLKKQRAIKIMPKNDDLDPKAVERFVKEARAAAVIEHPNIVHVHDIDENEDFYYIIMEFVQGSSLEDCVKKKGPMPARQAVRYTVEVAKGLSAIHKQNFVHRDIKPANILLCDSGEVKITDFGIVKEIGGETGDGGALTATSAIIGTPQFMSPEQITKKQMDGRSDLYSLGATLYFLITGKPCFTGTAMQMIYQVLQAPPIPPQEYNERIDDRLSAIILKMLNKEASDRYNDMDELQDVLEDYLIG